MEKQKILNDPIYGLMSFEYDVLYRIIDHPYFQRLRRISQMALSNYVYPSAQHTRFQHALGALHLLTITLQNLKAKGISISEEECKGVNIAILLHDIGHGPFSHALEGQIINLSHETISYKVMELIEKELDEDFTIAKQIYRNEYPRKFLNQLVSSQLDLDRMDYLTRDSFFSGVAEGVIGYDHIIKMLTVVNDTLVVEENGIYSIEKFLVARKLMYWQVYLHKATIGAEQVLVSTMNRIRYLIQNDPKFECNDNLRTLISYTGKEWDTHLIKIYLELDDVDLMYLMKNGLKSRDKILSILCRCVVERKLFKTSIETIPDEFGDTENIKKHIKNSLNIEEGEMKYFFIIKKETFLEYNHQRDEIMILKKNGDLLPFSVINPEFGLKKPVVKYAICYWEG